MPFAVPALFSVLSRYESEAEYSAKFRVLRLNRYRVCCMGTASVAQNPDAPGLIHGGFSRVLFENWFSLVWQSFKLDTADIRARHSGHSSLTQQSFQLDTLLCLGVYTGVCRIDRVTFSVQMAGKGAGQCHGSCQRYGVFTG